MEEAKEEVKAILVERVKDQLGLEGQLQETEQALMDNPQFKQFLDLQKSVNDQAESMWAYIEEKMLEHDIKKIKGEFGSIIIAERPGWDIDEDELPKKFFKKSVDTKKITDTYRLEGKAPKGCTPKVTKYLTKRLK